MTPLAYSSAWWRGFRAGYKCAGRSLLRRFLLQLVVAAVLLGGSIALCWESFEIYSRLSSGEPAIVKVIGIWEGWWRVFPR